MPTNEMPWYRRLLQVKLLSLLYAIFILFGICSYYAADQLWLYLPLSVLTTTGLFWLYEFTNRHKLKGGLLCFGIALLAFWLMDLFMQLGTAAYDGAYGDYYYFVWALTPSGVLDYNAGYTAATFLLFLGLISFATYYFCRVQYRIVITFVLMLLPVLLYGKDSVTIPLAVLVPLLLLYFLIMIHERQLVKPAPKHKFRLVLRAVQVPEKPVWNLQIWKSVGFFVIIAVAVSMAIPKPKVEANRKLIESLLNYQKLSDYLMKAISDFTDSSNGGDPTNRFGEQQVLLYLTGETPETLKTRTFTNYSLDDDTWYIGDMDQRFMETDWTSDAQLLDVSLLLEAVSDACAKDAEFAREYHLEAFNSLPEEELTRRSCTLRPQVSTLPFLLSPTNFVNADAHSYPESQRTFTGTISTNGVNSQDIYSFDYYLPLESDSQRLALLMDSMDIETWQSFLIKLYVNASQSQEIYQDVVMAYYKDSVYAKRYQEMYDAEISPRIASLATMLTKDCTTQREQIQALLDYFWNGEFTYNMDVRKKNTDNAETFLFDTKTGVCYQFATAMTLMCRSIGIPARYTEGFAVGEQDKDKNLYVIRYGNSHAFVEVYLNGYGWVGVDPTIADYSEKQEAVRSISKTQMIGIVFLSVAAVALLFYLLLYQRVCEALFVRSIRRKNGTAATVAMVKRLRKKAALAESLTLAELTDAMREQFLADIAPLTALCSAAVYGNRMPDAEAVKQVYQTYVSAKKQITEIQKQNRKNQKHIKRGNQMEIQKTKH